MGLAFFFRKGNSILHLTNLQAEDDTCVPVRAPTLSAKIKSPITPITHFQLFTMSRLSNRYTLWYVLKSSSCLIIQMREYSWYSLAPSLWRIVILRKALLYDPNVGLRNHPRAGKAAVLQFIHYFTSHGKIRFCTWWK